MKEIILDVCIASYNKSDLTYKLVKTILQCKNEKLGVVVVDNASDDDTFSQLQTIHDDRLKLIANPTNIGGAANMVRAIYSGGGVLPIL